MKILKEDKLPMKGPRYIMLKADIARFIDDCLDDALDNIAMAVEDEVEGYDAEWCEQDGRSPGMSAFNLAKERLVKEVTSLLLANKPE